MSNSLIPEVVSVNFPNQLQIDVYLTTELTQEQKLKKRTSLTNYVKKYPSGWKKRLELGHLLYSLGEWPQAIKEYQKVLRKKPKLIEVWLQLGHIFYLTGAKSQAINAYETALSLSSNQATQQQIKGLINAAQRRYQTAIKAIQTATKINPHHPTHWLSLGLTYLQVESPVAALQAFEQFLTLKPDDIKGLQYSHDALLAMGKIDKAQEKLHIAQQLAPNHINVLERVINHRLRQRLVHEQEGKITWELIEQVQQIAPDAVNTKCLQAYYHLFRQEISQGLTILEKFINNHSYNPGGWYHYAHYLFYIGKRQEAANAILTAYQLYQTDWQINRSMCEILPSVGKVERLRVRTLLTGILDNFPERWTVWVTTGRVLVEHFQEIEQGSYLSAQAIDLQPELPDTWFHHGRVLSIGGKYREAIEILQQGWQWLSQEESCLQSVLLAAQLGENYQKIGENSPSRSWWSLTAYHAQKMRDFHPTFATYWQNRANQILQQHHCYDKKNSQILVENRL
ncbi:MAG: tetratricopeptide repeat protein [Crocosphaera sp.]|nr:tetratricopeptide repeat protein [Crocosphaera sp.]